MTQQMVIEIHRDRVAGCSQITKKEYMVQKEVTAFECTIVTWQIIPHKKNDLRGIRIQMRLVSWVKFSFKGGLALCGTE